MRRIQATFHLLHHATSSWHLPPPQSHTAAKRAFKNINQIMSVPCRNRLGLPVALRLNSRFLAQADTTLLRDPSWRVLVRTPGPQIPRLLQLPDHVPFLDFFYHGSWHSHHSSRRTRVPKETVREPQGLQQPLLPSPHCLASNTVPFKALSPPGVTSVLPLPPRPWFALSSLLHPHHLPRHRANVCSMKERGSQLGLCNQSPRLGG